MRFHQFFFLNSSKYDDIGPAAAKPYRQFLLDGGLVALQTGLHAVAADSSTGRDKRYTVKRPDVLCQKRFELQQNLSGTYPDIRLFQFCYDFCDTSSDRCDTRTKKYQKLFAVNDG